MFLSKSLFPSPFQIDMFLLLYSFLKVVYRERKIKKVIDINQYLRTLSFLTVTIQKEAIQGMAPVPKEL